MKWISVEERLPSLDEFYCWTMNTRRGAFGFVCGYYHDEKIFQLLGGSSDKSPALDVTHWYPLPAPEYQLHQKD